MAILVTGGAGFIGSNFVLDWLKQTDELVLNVDQLTYAGNLENLAELKDDVRHYFTKGDIADSHLIGLLLSENRPRAVLNFAAESHVDRSIHGPEDFIRTNVLGTFHLLETVRNYWQNLPVSAVKEKITGVCQEEFRFYISPLMRFMARLLKMKRLSPRLIVTNLIVLTVLVRLLAIIWYVPGIRLMVCRCLLLIALIITGPINFQKN